MTELSRRELLLGAAAGAAGLILPGVVGSSGAVAATKKTSTLRIGAQSTPADVLDPRNPVDYFSGYRGLNVYQRFLVDTPTGPAALLAKEWSVSPDGLTWKFSLDPRARFHNGKKVTSDDALFSLAEFAKNPEAGARLQVIDFAKSRKIDATTFEVAMKFPNAAFDEFLATSYVVVLPKGTGPITKPSQMIGSGPYAVKDFAAGRRTTLVRAKNWWGGTAPIETIVLVGIADTIARGNALLAGQIDMAPQFPYALAKANASNAKIKIVKGPRPTGLAFFLNMGSGPLADAKVREAIKLGVDRKALADTLLFGFGEPGNDLWGKGYPTYASEIPQRAYDPAKAKSLLSEVGGKVDLTFVSSAIAAGMAEAGPLMAEQLKSIGINLKTDTIPPDQYYADVKKWFDYNGAGFSAVYDPVLMSTVTKTSQAPYNFGWKRPDWEKRFMAAGGITDRTKRYAEHRALQRDLWDDGFDLVWGYAPDLCGTAPNVVGDPFDLVSNFPQLQRLSLA